MGAADVLRGKKVLIATTENWAAGALIKSLAEDKGASVIVANDSPHHPDNLPAIIGEMTTHKPDALVIHYVNLNTDNSEAQRAVDTLIQEAKKQDVPVTFIGLRPKKTVVAELEAQGVSSIDAVDRGIPQQVFAVEQSIVQKGKGGAARGVATGPDKKVSYRP